MSKFKEGELVIVIDMFTNERFLGVINHINEDKSHNDMLVKDFKGVLYGVIGRELHKITQGPNVMANRPQEFKNEAI